MTQQLRGTDMVLRLCAGSLVGALQNCRSCVMLRAGRPDCKIQSTTYTFCVRRRVWWSDGCQIGAVPLSLCFMSVNQSDLSDLSGCWWACCWKEGTNQVSFGMVLVPFGDFLRWLFWSILGDFLVAAWSPFGNKVPSGNLT